MAQHPHETFADIVVGCYDYDPFGSFLPFPVIMIRQDIDGMIAKAFEMMSEKPARPVQTYLIQPELVPPRTALERVRSTPSRIFSVSGFSRVNE